MNRLTLIAVAGIISLGLGVKLASSKAPQTTAQQPAKLPLSTAQTSIPVSVSQNPTIKLQPQPVSKLPSIIISSCNGELGDANFRSSPSMANSAIAGVIESGQSVYLTGRIVQSDGEVWHEVTFPGASRDPGRESATDQTGWIAGCFVR